MDSHQASATASFKQLCLQQTPKKRIIVHQTQRSWQHVPQPQQQMNRHSDEYRLVRMTVRLLLWLWNMLPTLLHLVDNYTFLGVC